MSSISQRPAAKARYSVYLLYSTRPREIGERIGVSSTTVSNRISQLEEEGIIVTYQPTIDYERAGLDHHLLVTAPAPIDERADLAEQALDVYGVVSVRELLANRERLQIELAASTRQDVAETLEELTALELEFVRTEPVKREFHQLADHFGRDVAEELAFSPGTIPGCKDISTGSGRCSPAIPGS